jgi:dinuclear metal center YbgI/SA1388 family protein
MPSDNIGLIAGSATATVSGVVVALDLTSAALDMAEKNRCNLIVVHHPPIFYPIKRLDAATPQGALLMRAIKGGISVYAMHTNLDSAPRGLNSHVAALLGLRKIRPATAQGITYRIGVLPRVMDGARFARHVKQKLGLSGVRLYGGRVGAISTVAVCTGSGADLLANALSHGAEALVTGDVRHHHAIEAAECGAALVDAGHWGTERPMAGLVSGYLKKMMVKSRKRIRIVSLCVEEPYESY